VEIYIPLEELIEIDKEIDRLNKEREHLKAELARVDAKLGNEKFINKAPANIVNEEREKREKYLGMFESATQRLETMKKLKK
ncbi:MAG: hypothetical protein PHX37_05675, partial [Eubacteriales bacterium]|nr:hypothetical protein [Eubacteriales bacterium]